MGRPKGNWTKWGGGTVGDVNDQAFDAIEETQVNLHKNPVYDPDLSTVSRDYALALGLIAHRSGNTELMRRLEAHGHKIMKQENGDPAYLTQRAMRIVGKENIPKADGMNEIMYTVRYFSTLNNRWEEEAVFYLLEDGLLAEDGTIQQEFQVGDYLIAEGMFNILYIGETVSEEEAEEFMKENSRMLQGLGDF